MKELTLNQAHDLLKQSTAVVVNGRVHEPIMIGLQDHDLNEFMFITWDEEQNRETVTKTISFQEGDNHVTILVGSVLTLFSTEETEEDLVLLKEFDAESMDWSRDSNKTA